jgi:hypothetical protein
VKFFLSSSKKHLYFMDTILWLAFLKILLTDFTTIMKSSNKSSWNLKTHTTLGKDTTLKCLVTSSINCFCCSVAHFILKGFSWNCGTLGWKGILSALCCRWRNWRILTGGDLIKSRYKIVTELNFLPGVLLPNNKWNNIYASAQNSF